MERTTHVRDHKRRKRSGGTTDVSEHDRNLKDSEKPQRLNPKRLKKEIDLGGLSAAAVEVKPRHFDYSKGYTETWDFFDADECWECGTLVVGRGAAPECPKCGTVQDSMEGPMMNYFYPLPYFSQDPEEAAEKLEDLPLCLVHRLDEDADDYDEWGLALTGGGMNLSWEICQAYIKLGYLPPAHFCSLPRMAGKCPSPENLEAVAACKKSLELKSSWSQGTARELEGIEETWERDGRL